MVYTLHISDTLLPLDNKMYVLVCFIMVDDYKAYTLCLNIAVHGCHCAWSCPFSHTTVSIFFVTSSLVVFWVVTGLLSRLFGCFWTYNNLYLRGETFLLSGAYAPFIWNAFLIYLKISKNSKQKCFVYMSMFYVPRKLFQQKVTFYMVYVKMTKFGTKIGLFAMHVFVFFSA
jgi:hypothetical protein